MGVLIGIAYNAYTYIAYIPNKVSGVLNYLGSSVGSGENGSSEDGR